MKAFTKLQGLFTPCPKNALVMKETSNKFIFFVSEYYNDHGHPKKQTIINRPEITILVSNYSEPNPLQLIAFIFPNISSFTVFSPS